MRSFRRPGASCSRLISGFARPVARTRYRLVALLTAVLAGGGLLTLVPACPAAAQTQGPAPGVTLAAAANGTQPPRLFYAGSDGQVWMHDLAQPSGSPVSLGGRLIGGPGGGLGTGRWAVPGRGVRGVRAGSRQRAVVDLPDHGWMVAVGFPGRWAHFQAGRVRNPSIRGFGQRGGRVHTRG